MWRVGIIEDNAKELPFWSRYYYVNIIIFIIKWNSKNQLTRSCSCVCVSEKSFSTRFLYYWGYYPLGDWTNPIATFVCCYLAKSLAVRYSALRLFCFHPLFHLSFSSSDLYIISYHIIYVYADAWYKHRMDEILLATTVTREYIDAGRDNWFVFKY